MPESAFPLELGIPLLAVGAASGSGLPFPAVGGPEPAFSFVFVMSVLEGGVSKAPADPSGDPWSAALATGECVLDGDGR